MDKKTVMELAMKTGEMLLASGGSTHKIEGIIRSILNTRELTKTEIFVTTSGIVVTIESKTTGVMTMVKNVPVKSMHMERIALIEEIIFEFINDRISADEALKQLKNISSKNTYSFFTSVIAFGGAASFRTLMFGGTLIDGLASIFVGIFLGIFIKTLNSKSIIGFLVSICGGFVVGYSSVLFMRFGIGSQLDKIIIGSIIPIAPGVPLTHAVNDILNGDYISGNIRAMEALLTGVAIAIGIATSLQFWSLIIGGVFA